MEDSYPLEEEPSEGGRLNVHVVVTKKDGTVVDLGDFPGRVGFEASTDPS